jgi:hypothetical protein
MIITKQFFWRCKCGAVNYAPADQSPGGTVQCAECDKVFEWRQVKDNPPKEENRPTTAKPC